MMISRTAQVLGCLLACFLPLSAQAAFDAQCIRTQSVRGDDCNHLVVHFDFAACGLEAPTSRDVRSQCVNQKAVAVVRTSDSVYIATYGAPLDQGGSWVYLSVRRQDRARQPVPAPPEAPQTSDIESAPVLSGGGGGAPAVVVPAVSTEAMPVPSAAAPTPAPAISNAPVRGMKVELKPSKIPSGAPGDEPLPQEEEHGPADKVLQKGASETAPVAAPTAEAAVAPAVKELELPSAEPQEKSETLVTLPSGVKVSGLLDFYYLYNLNVPNPVSNIPSSTSTTMNTPPTGNNTNRLFDNYHDTFTLNLAEITLKKEMENGAAQVDLGFGNQATVSSPNDTATQNIMRAFITWKLADNVDLRAGKLFSHLGVEEPYATENMNYSRSLLFSYAVPLWNTGLALDWKLVPNSWTASFFVYNNNGNSAYENDAAKSVGFRLEWKDDNTRVRYNMQAGASNLALDQLRQYHELNVKWHFLGNWSLVADGMMGYQPNGVSYPTTPGNQPSDAYWSAEWLGVEWKHKKWSIAPRFEYYSDPQGYTVNGAYGANTTSSSYLSQNLTSFTTTFGYQISEGAKAIFEVRQDSSDQLAYYNYSGATPVSSTTPNASSQTTLTAAFVYDF